MIARSAKRLAYDTSLRYMIVAGAVAALLALINFPFGFAEDPDAYLVFQNALEFPEEGYERSRTWGFPSYEILVYPMIHYLGVSYAKLYSLVFYVLASMVLFSTLQRLGADPLRSFLGALCFVVLPTSIVNSNTVMDTSQGIFFAILGLYFYVRFHASRRNMDFFLTVAALGLATSTRPDYVLLSASVALTILIFDKASLRNVVLGTAVWAMFALLPFAIYGDVFLSSSVVLEDPLTRKLFRTAFGYAALFGIPATTLIALWTVRNYKDWFTLAKRVFRDNVLFLFVASAVLYTIRFAMLPDEPEYILVLVPIFICVMMKLDIRRVSLIILLIAIAIPNLIQVHLFDRTDIGELVADVGVSPGAIAQDRSVRLQNEYINTELAELMDVTARSYGFEEYAVLPRSQAGKLVIMSEEMLRHYSVGRAGGEYYRALASNRVKVVVYPMPTYRGWQQFIEFEQWRKVGSDDFREVKEPPVF